MHCGTLVFLVSCLFGAYGRLEDYASHDELDFVAYGKKKVPSLEIVYNRLAILTRITSAISLQYAAIKKTVKVRDVITELLRAHHEDFDYLTKVDTKEMISGLKEKFESSMEMRKMRKDMEKLEEKKGMLELMNAAMEYVEGQQINMTQLENFYTSIKNEEFDKTTIGCSKDTVTTVTDFYNLLIDSSDKPIDTQNQLISEMSKIHPKLLDCFKSLETYDVTISEISQQFENFAKLGESKEGISKFHDSKNDAKHFGKTIDLVIKVFSKTEKFWKFSEVGSVLAGILVRLVHILDPDHEKPELSLTLGFPEHGDMAKVSSDLRSDWFKEKVAHGKSIYPLGKELQGFFKFALLMRELEKSWEVLKHKFPEYKSTVLKLSKKLESIEKMKMGSNDLAIAQASKTAFEESWINELTFKTEQLEIIEDELKLVENLISGVGEIQTRAAEIGQEVDKAAVRSFMEQLEGMKMDGEVAKILEGIRKFTNLESIKLLGEKFSDLKSSQQKLQDHLKAMRKEMAKTSNSDKKSIIQSLRTSGLRKNLDNLKAQETKFQPGMLLKMLKFSKTIYEISEKDENFQSAQNFLNHFKSMIEDLLETENFVKNIGPMYQKTHEDDDENYSNPILKLENAQEMALSLSRGMYVLRDMIRGLRYRRRINRTMTYTNEVHEKIIQYNKNQYVKEFWAHNRDTVAGLIKDLEGLNKYARKIQEEPLLVMRKILDEATKIQGFPEVFKPIFDQLKESPNFEVPRKNFEILADLDLDFASHKGYLHAASMSFDELKTFFDEIFGLDGDSNGQEVEHSHLTAILICFSIFILIIIGAIVAYGLTPTGKKKYKNLYLFYFGKPNDFEKRWRYSLFLDRQDGKNALLDAAREINATNVLKTVRKGAYINVYNKFGNTALHVASKRGHPEIVEILIRNGADRSMLNAQNKTAEQMIPEKYRESHPDKVERFQKVENIFKKFQKKKFRQRVPNEFPVSSYHIYVDTTTDDTLTDKFTEKFQSIITDEASPTTTTHIVVRTDKDGILETENLDLLNWILSGLIVVQDKWMTECLKNNKQISNEWEFLVKKIRYKGTVYDTLDQWREAMAKSTMPFLQGVYVAVVIVGYPNLIPLASIVATHGGVVCDQFPEKQNFNIGFRPYLHSDMGPFIIIHDGKVDLSKYKNDPDRMYTPLTEQEFVHFLLKRKIHRDRSRNPIQAMNDLED